MSLLPWILDGDFTAAVKTLRDRSNTATSSAAKNMEKNVIDPFSSLIIASTLDVDTSKNLVNIQKSGSTLGGISNALGNFHQDILGSISGWKNHDAGYDLESVEKRMIAEVKNKHNTMNASNREAILKELDTAIKQKGNGWEGYLVIILPKKPERYEKKLPTPRPVYEIDGASFYTKVTGYENALHELFESLMKILEEMSGHPFPSDIEAYCRSIMSRSIPK